MSLSDRIGRKWLFASLMVAYGLTLQACQVQPLYATNTLTAQNLASVGIEPVDTRVAQVLRNRLIFLYSGGQGEPSRPVYTMNLNFNGRASAALREELSEGITAQHYSATARFKLVDNETKKVIGSGTRTVTTFYDQTTQEFANLRALRDTENRAAQQLAEIIRADTASILSRNR